MARVAAARVAAARVARVAALGLLHCGVVRTSKGPVPQPEQALDLGQVLTFGRDLREGALTGGLSTG